MDAFGTALAYTLKFEGGYANDPNDPGGETNFGITHATYDGYRQHQGLLPQSVKHITREEVADIYRTMYWDKASCAKMPDKLAIAVFDFAVNSGVGRAIKILQSTFDITADGICGPDTLAHIASADANVLTGKYLDARAAYDKRLTEIHPSETKFLAGWDSRINKLRELLLT